MKQPQKQKRQDATGVRTWGAAVLRPYMILPRWKTEVKRVRVGVDVWRSWLGGLMGRPDEGEEVTRGGESCVRRGRSAVGQDAGEAELGKTRGEAELWRRG
jgi:hypothetical protein